MNAAIGDTSSAVLPPDDGAVARTLAELKTKLAAWTNAVSEVQGKLAESAERLARSETTAQNREEPETAVADDAGDSIPADANGNSPTAANSDFESMDAALLDSLDPAMAQLIRLRYHLFRGRKNIQQLIADEEEALLDSLEPEVAKAVRVEHRLFHGRKSAMQLIQEYEARPMVAEEKARWWKRVTR